MCVLCKASRRGHEYRDDNTYVDNDTIGSRDQATLGCIRSSIDAVALARLKGLLLYKCLTSELRESGMTFVALELDAVRAGNAVARM